MEKQELLLVEDDPAVLAALRRRLLIEGYIVHTAVTGLMALEVYESVQPDLVILDVMLPEMDGLAVARHLRKNSSGPILMLTARDSVQARVQGLECGADDYLVKPFAFEELLARIRALLRRAKPVVEEHAEEKLRFAHVELGKQSRQVFSDGNEVSLTAREFDLLAFFMTYPRHVLTRERIFSEVWGHDHEGSSNVIDVYMRSLRDKLESGGQPRVLQTVRGVGYVLRE